MQENKYKICDLLLPALQATRDLWDLKSLTYEKNGDKETVIAEFISGHIKRANVSMDSGLAMIRDITRQLS